jgi:uncharacterized repeat protein (TIGR03803 family)
MKNQVWARVAAISLALGACSSHANNNLVLQRLATFGMSDDDTQVTSLIQGVDRCLYGTTGNRRATNGNVFKMTPSGEVTALASFDPNSIHPGNLPGIPGLLVQAADGNFFGAAYPGASGNGVIFRLTTNGTSDTLFSFNGANGRSARVLIYGSDGNLYGTTSDGGDLHYGTIFQLKPTGEFNTLFSFSRTNGINPTSLVRASDGTLFGTTSDWIGVGAPDLIYKLTPAGQFTVLVSSFTSSMLRPWSPVLGADGNIYALDRAGGPDRFGSILKVTPTGDLSVLASFDGTNGWDPDRLIQGSDGTLYGTTAAGGPDSAGWIADGEGGYDGSGSGSIFKLTPGGELSALGSFETMPGDDVVGFVQDADCVFYGARTSGAVGEPSAVFRLAPPPAVTQLKHLEGHDVLTWSAFSGGTYQVEYKPTLPTGSWTTVSPSVVATDSGASVTIVRDTTEQCYYRVRLLP